ncbi:MAG: amidase, partial [Pseudomonadales bacterium]|nr:amidase [Pseudomonadales bacterium]
MADTNLCHMTASRLKGLITRREISAVELLDAHLEHIDRVNPSINAIVTLVPDIARAQAREIDARLARGESVGPLAGLPIAHKDLLPTAGIRTTHGSRLHADDVPAEDALLVTRLRRAGAVTLGKTNTPEWGAGSHTFNDVFGATANPWDTTRSAGGSSGGAGAALAARLLPIADGSDMGGSLRNPGNFNNVVGMRPSPGRVPVWPTPMGWSPLGVLGPMARTVTDCALLLAAMSGPDPRSPISIEESGDGFLGELARDFRGTRVAFSPDFGGQLPVAPEVRGVIADAAKVLERIGCEVALDCPDFSGADEAFKTLRAWSFASKHSETLAR